MASLKKSAILLTLLAIVVKLSGFLRESIMTSQFGASHYTDGYIMAFSFITLALAMISGGFNNVFLPLYVKNKKEDPKKAEQSANGIMNATVLIFLVLSVIGYFIAPYLVPLIFPSAPADTEAIAISITQFFILFISAIALNGILDSYLQGRRIFVPSQVSKLVATIMGVVFVLLFSEQWGINSLAYGFIAGTILGSAIQFYYLRKSGYHWQPTLKIEKEFGKTLLVLLVPSLLNSVVGQINMFVNKSFAASTGLDGVVTYLNNASMLVTIPHAIYGTTIAVIIFTLLSEQLDNPKKFQSTFFTGMQISFVTLMPIAVGLLLVGEQTLSFIFERGKYTAEDTHSAYLALVFYVPMIVTQGLQYIVSRSMYARGKTAIIFRISVTTIILNAFLNWLLLSPYGYTGLALSSSFVSVYYLVVSGFVVYKDFDRSELFKLLNLIVRVLIPTVIMAVPLYLLQKFTAITELYSLVQLMILIPLGAILYTGGLYVFYKDGFRQLLAIVKKRKKA